MNTLPFDRATVLKTRKILLLRQMLIKVQLNFYKDASTL